MKLTGGVKVKSSCEECSGKFKGNMKRKVKKVFACVLAIILVFFVGYKIKQDVEAEIYREYMARCARLCAENTAKAVHGSYMKAEYADIINPKPKEQERTGEEIAADIIARMGLEVI